MSEATPTPETTPAAASVETQAAPDAAAVQEAVQPTAATPAASESAAAATPAAQPAAPAPAATPAAPAPEPDPMIAVKADLARLEAEVNTHQATVTRITNENTQLQQALDAERANPGKPGTEAYVAQVGQMRLQISALEAENAHLKTTGQPAATGTLSTADLAAIKEVFLQALLEHSIAQVAPEAAQPEPPAAPSSPFINRQG